MLIYLDESGDHNLDQSKLDNQFNIFLLGGVVFHDEEEYKKFDLRFRKLKKDLFDDENFILHTAEITRPRRSKNAKNQLFNSFEFRKKFYSTLDNLILETKFEIVACGIFKAEFVVENGATKEDPYIFSYQNILDRVLLKAKHNNGLARIYPEKRGYPEDQKLEMAMLRHQTLGTEFYSPSEVRKLIKDFNLKDKQENLSGSQLADLIVTPIARSLLKKKPKPKGNEPDIEIIKSKIIRGDLITHP